MRYMDLARHQRIGLSTGITPCRVSNGILVKSTCTSKKTRREFVENHATGFKWLCGCLCWSRFGLC